MNDAAFTEDFIDERADIIARWGECDSHAWPRFDVETDGILIVLFRSGRKVTHERVDREHIDVHQ